MRAFHLAAIPLLLALGACAGGEREHEQMSYQQALARTAQADTLEPGSQAEAAALERVRAFFSQVSEQRVRELAGQVYAPDAFLNDTLKTVVGGPAIEEYFIETARRARRVTVEFLDVARSGREYYLRWTMTIEADRINGGRPLVSQGMSHMRFDAQGRVVLHQDYWDSAAGLFEHLPLLGSLIRAVKARL